MAHEARMRAWFICCETRTKRSSQSARRWSPPRPPTRAPDSRPGPFPTETLEVLSVERTGEVWTSLRFLCEQYHVYTLRRCAYSWFSLDRLSFAVLLALKEKSVIPRDFAVVVHLLQEAIQEQL